MSLLKRLLQDRDNGSYLFNAIRRHRLKQEQDKVANHVWDGKVHPSSLSFDLCMEDYFESVSSRTEWFIDNIYKAASGTAKHKEYQDECLLIEGLLWPKPTNVSPEIAAKIEETWPEIPVKYPPAGISGRVDLVLNVRGKPLLVDIKSTSVNPDEWAEKMEKAKGWLQGRFQDIPRIREAEYYRKYYTQLCSYIHMANLSNYYDQKIERGGLAYVNMLMPAGSKGSEVEIYWDFTPEIEAMCNLLFEHLAIHRNAKLAGKKEECKYPLCEKHNDKKTTTASPT